jgi:hypothetical protein
MWIFYIGIWNILLPFGIFYGNLVHFVVIWYIITRLDIFYQEQSGNPDFYVEKLKNSEEIFRLTMSSRKLSASPATAFVRVAELQCSENKLL